MRRFFAHVAMVGLVAVAATPAWAPPVPPCIDYKVIGDSGCSARYTTGISNYIDNPQQQLLPPPSLNTEINSFPAPALTAPQEQPLLPIPQSVEPAPEDLDKKVDEFLENHGKPPREYVEFMMNPTLENALRWAQKYKRDNERTQAIVKAWQQAEEILKTAETRGVEVPDLSDPEVPVPDFSTIVNAVGGTNKWASPDKEIGGVQTARDAAKTTGIGGISARQQALTSGGSLTAAAAKKAAQTAKEGVIDSVIKVSYYFSAECPFCAKFEPEFQSVINRLGKALEVTCVDMTPSGKQQANINGKVSCRWRPLMPNEMKNYKITSTPTLLIDRGKNRPLERLAGFVDRTRLYDYLVNGR